MIVTTIPTQPKNTNKKSNIGFILTNTPKNPIIHEMIKIKWSLFILIHTSLKLPNNLDLNECIQRPPLFRFPILN